MAVWISLSPDFDIYMSLCLSACVSLSAYSQSYILFPAYVSYLGLSVLLIKHASMGRRVEWTATTLSEESSNIDQHK